MEFRVRFFRDSGRRRKVGAERSRSREAHLDRSVERRGERDRIGLKAAEVSRFVQQKTERFGRPPRNLEAIKSGTPPHGQPWRGTLCFLNPWTGTQAHPCGPGEFRREENRFRAFGNEKAVVAVQLNLDRAAFLQREGEHGLRCGEVQNRPGRGGPGRPGEYVIKT